MNKKNAFVAMNISLVVLVVMFTLMSRSLVSTVRAAVSDEGSVVSDPGGNDDQDGPAGITSDPSSNPAQDGAAGITSSPSGDEDQDGPAGIVSSPGNDEDQDDTQVVQAEHQQNSPATQPLVSSQGSSSSGSSGSTLLSFVPVISPSLGGGQVLGASASCGIYLDTPLAYGGKNDSQDVERLQAFMNEAIGSELSLNGIFNKATLAAVKKFQQINKSLIIDPWISNGKNPHGIATGYVGTTTLWTINNMICPSLQLPKPTL